MMGFENNSAKYDQARGICLLMDRCLNISVAFGKLIFLYLIHRNIDTLPTFYFNIININL